MTAKAGTGSLRTLARGLQELERLKAIERAARELLDSEYPRPFGPPTFDVEKIDALQDALSKRSA